ncbi:uncharacterized protein BXZ73DRAFT_105010 [Epithele typhae]|uniref:uncharacterized protein n=1 Tax=Epithele typhae TaxID=378194 RepID=UPI002007C59B|nr:uncharacterized protein BXZ73DRAFT_105010 [Epithele typhae]KAH9919181.1 hypothetical protein BXZ73DRAFT_105010 [Epithele typhae]
MPSINRLLVLVILGVSLSAQAIPVPDDSTDVELFTNDGPNVDTYDVNSVPTANDIFDSDDVESAALDADADALGRRATKPKAPVKVSPAKPPAKAPVVAPPVKTPAKAPAKATTTPAKATTTPVKAPTSPAKPTGKTCTANKFKNKPRATRERAFSEFDHLFGKRVVAADFIGWHGTNSDTATFWAAKGQLEKPVKPSGFFDFFDFSSKQSAGTSGADAENGPGVYITDDKDIAIAFANNNAKVNPGTTPMLCAIFAKTAGNWENVIRKVFLPETLVGDSSNPVTKQQKEKARLDYIARVAPGISAVNVVRFSLLNRSTRTGQLVLPAGITNQFTAQCVATTATTLPTGTGEFPAFSYDGATLRTQWDIAAEQQCAAP